MLESAPNLKVCSPPKQVTELQKELQMATARMLSDDVQPPSGSPSAIARARAAAVTVAPPAGTSGERRML